MSDNATLPIVSVIVPLYNEADIVEPMMKRLSNISSPLARIEWVFVDDGSRDATSQKIKSHINVLRHWRIIQLIHNFGQQQAYRAGLDQIQSDACVFLDADLQDPPELIPEMIELWKAGNALVVPCRKSRQESGLKGLAFKTFHRLFNKMTGGIMPENSGTFGLMDRSIIERLQQMPETTVFYQALRCWASTPPAILWYDRDKRLGGDPKQSLGRLFRQAWDATASFSETPLRSISYLGFSISVFGFMYTIILITLKFLQFLGYFQHLVVLGFTTVAVAILVLGGIQLIAIGILGEYIARIFQEVKRRPTYFIGSIEKSSSP